jgi:hypothetical protein
MLASLRLLAVACVCFILIYFNFLNKVGWNPRCRVVQTTWAVYRWLNYDTHNISGTHH